MQVKDYDKVKLTCPDVSAILILRTLERISDVEEAISIIKDRPIIYPICWNFHYSKWVTIDSLSLNKKDR